MSKITLTVAGTDYNFNITPLEHNDFVDAAARGESMTTAAHNFAIRTIEPAQKEDFKKLLESSPGCELQIAGTLKAEYSPVLEITVKK